MQFALGLVARLKRKCAAEPEIIISPLASPSSSLSSAGCREQLSAWHLQDAAQSRSAKRRRGMAVASCLPAVQASGGVWLAGGLQAHAFGCCARSCLL
mgnify:CR=1 FL=1